jgi:transposase
VSTDQTKNCFNFLDSYRLEAVNTKIQALKSRGCGYRNRDRLRNAILFHCVGLDLYPQLAAAHTKS